MPDQTIMRQPRHSLKRGFLTEPIPLIGGLVGFCISIILSGDIISAVAVALFFVCASMYIDALGKEIAIPQTIGLVLTGQLLLGPFIAYNFNGTSGKYYMYVDENTYYSFVLPAAMAFLGGLFLVAPRIYLSELRTKLLSEHRLSARAVFIMLMIGVGSGFGASGAPSSWLFILYLISQIKFIAVIYAIVYKDDRRYIYVVIAFLSALIQSAGSGLFHDLLLWSALFFSFLCFDLRFGALLKTTIVLVGLIGIGALQSVKGEYRTHIALNPGEAGPVLLLSKIGDLFFSNGQIVTSGAELNVRLNEGWIVSAVMAHVPTNIPFQEGDTIVTAVVDSLMPRFLYEKRVVSVSDNFRKFTGLNVGQDTSFGISTVGEAWVNFGYFGIIFMFVLGAFNGAMLLIARKLSKRSASIMLWAPLLFLQAVKAETELVVVANHIVKSGVFIAAIYFFTTKILKVRI